MLSGRILVLVRVLALCMAIAVNGVSGTFCDFEKACSWKPEPGFKVVTGQEVNNSWIPGDGQLGGPFSDADNNTHGHFLYLLVKKPSTTTKEYHITSPEYPRTADKCHLSLWIHMSNMIGGNLKVVLVNSNKTSWFDKEKYGNNNNSWENHSFNIGRITQPFTIILVVTHTQRNRYPLHVAIDNIRLLDCFPEEHSTPKECSPVSQFQCYNNACIEATRVCNIELDCPNGEDEEQDCSEVPHFARCDFEEDTCGWHNKNGNHLKWIRNKGMTATPSTGPSNDHTFQNSSGYYMYVDMSGRKYDMGTPSELESPIFDPPPTCHNNNSSPYYNSCYISFFYHKYGPHSGSLGLFLVELQRTNITSKLWWSYGDKGNKWIRQVVRLPNITHRYYFQFEARKSFASRGDPGIDDISLSPKCFGIGIPPAHLGGYVYGSSTITPVLTTPPEVHPDFANSTYYLFGTCGAKGRYGPDQDNCTEAYNNTDVTIKVMKEKLLQGVQQWTVPHNGIYTLIARGGSGGRGSGGLAESRGAMVRTVLELKKGQQLYILVGQEGNDACKKDMAANRSSVCNLRSNTSKKGIFNALKEIKKLTYLPEGGGGGGATYVFTMSQKNKEKKPVIVAAGGGGLSHNSIIGEVLQYGHGINVSLQAITGDASGLVPAGAGGGWKSGNLTYRITTGLALLQGAVGGGACYETIDNSDKGAGGFGGGGGGCTSGGGGGGYSGGRAWAGKSTVGEGGYSWIETGSHRMTWIAQNRGPGALYVIPAIEGCGCDFLCIALDTYRSKVECICPANWHLSNNSVQCLMNPLKETEMSFKMMLGVMIISFLLICLACLCIYLYNRYQRTKVAMMRSKTLSGPDLQLNRLRVASNSMMTEYNPNYEFGGGVYSLRDLKEIPREHLRLVKALGQGAFGEVYQGFFKNRAGDAVEMPVAVKTLPELSSSQAETDFLMEALIMSKFNHPNIVHFIGVCFGEHPRFIVIELLAGGDLKTFLREARPKPDRAAPLTMKDLLNCIIDVAKGCKYMEENRFIHRDIAARNCLLTSKGPGRVVKIADFGMARDIYRADYYRKGGKAMLPIKWMPPEAFMDGIFTTKTDVWSFGVLMWEVMSMGYMPYTGCTNREVMQLVTNGGRLAPPTNCPSQLYGIMTQCWQPNPDNRPGFPLILERLGYCMQDPDVIKAPLPDYTKPPPSELDTTIMRPSALEECIQPDYLVPLPGPPEWDLTQQLPESRSTHPLLEHSSTSNTSPPATTNNNNQTTDPSVIPANKPHLVDHTDQPVYIVSSNIKQDGEVSC
ncbi:leukocyte tyrosine kinase receptor isoform X3 [Cimex lectularius]|uniref:Tyrosine-protein kinase receptor n=1 Tax=Cimex lectularius TaxID=79782 RepID=A0A8I6SK21_CIMLE|nr:leukocyte tyrosine kinase receptor isoform X3 [Cimex lectularius]